MSEELDTSKSIRLWKPKNTREFVALWISVCSIFLALAAWGVSSPVGSTPDEDFHLVSIWCTPSLNSNLCQETGLEKYRVIGSSVAGATCFVGNEQISAECQETSNVFDLKSFSMTERGNFLSKYPPFFYKTMSFFATDDVQLSVLKMRVFNSLLFAILFAVGITVIPKYLRVTFIGMWVVCLIPLGMFLISSINPSSWTIMGVGFSFIAFCALMLKINQSPRPKSQKSSVMENFGLISFALLSSFLAVGSRVDGGLYLAVSLICAVVLTLNRVFLSKTAVLAISVVFVSVLILFLTTNNTVLTPATLAPSENHAGKSSYSVGLLLVKNILQLPEIWAGVFGGGAGLGALDAGMPAIIPFANEALFLGMIFVSIVYWGRRQIILFASLVAILIFLPLIFLQYRNAVVGEFFQARYLLPVFLLVAGVALFNAEHGFLLNRRHWHVVAVILVLTNSLAMYVLTSRYAFGGLQQNELMPSSGYQFWGQLGINQDSILIIGNLAFICFFVAVSELLFLHKHKNKINSP